MVSICVRHPRWESSQENRFGAWFASVSISPSACFKPSAFIILKHGVTLHLDFDAATSRAERQRQASWLLSLQTSASEGKPCSSRSAPGADTVSVAARAGRRSCPRGSVLAACPGPHCARLVTGHGAHPHHKLTNGLLYKVKSCCCCNCSLGSGERSPVLTVSRRAAIFQYG